MATQFDAVARLSVDLRGFASASRTMTQQGGTMQKVFRDLHNVLNQVEVVEKGLAAELRRTLGVYSAVANAATKYANAVKALQTSSAGSATAVQNMSKAFTQLRTALSSITGLGEKEAARLQRTLGLYNQMASVLLKVNQATATAAKTTQQAGAAEQQRLINSERLAAAQARTTSAQERLNQQLNQQRGALAGATSAQNQYNTSLGNGGRLTLALRSDLSELEQIYRKLASVITASATASVNAAISHEASFAQVLRVTQETGKGADEMRASFEKLTTQLPVSFEELSKIGQLAAQTGVANDQLVAFSRTVVQFAVTSGIASDQVTVLFARIADMLNLPTNQMNNFASTILKLGTISAATEAEILKVTQSIASSARAFGLSTQEVAGLSGALASLRIPPEWARGSATRIFRDLDNAANKAGAGMGVLVEVLGMSATEITKLRNTDPGEFFQRFVEGMQKFTREGQLAAGTTRTITDVLGDLDIKAVRDVDFVTRLANNFGTLQTQTHEAFLEFARGTELTKQTEIIFGTTRQTIDNLRDAFQTFLAKAGDPFAKVIGFIADRLTGAIEAFQNFSSGTKTFFSVLIGGTTVMAALAAMMAVYKGALIRTARSVIAFNQVQRDMNGQAITGRNVWRLYQEQQAQTRQAIAGTTGAQREQAATQGAVTRATQQTTAATGAAAQASNQMLLASQRNATGQRAVTVSLERSAGAASAMQMAFRAQEASQRAAIQGAASYAAALRQVGPSIRAVATSQDQAVRSSSAFAAATRTVAIQQDAIRNNGPAMAAAMTAYSNAATSSAASSTAAATGLRGVGASMVAAAAATRVAVGALSLFKVALASIGIGILITGLTALYQALTNTKNAAKEASQAGFEAAGGFTSLGEAIAKDTAAVKSGSLPAYADLTSSVKDLSGAQQAQLKTAQDRATSEQRSIRLVGSSIESLREQAKGTGAAAAQARDYVKRWEAAQAVLDEVNSQLGNNTRYLSENSQALVRNAVEQSLMNNAASKNVDALARLEAIAPQVNRAIDLAFKDPTKAADILSDEIKLVQTELTALNNLPQRSVSGEEIERRAGVKKDLEDTISLLDTLKFSISGQNADVRRADISFRLFGKNAKAAAEDVAKGADEASNGLDGVGEAASEMGGELEDATSRAQGLSSAFSSLGGISSAYASSVERAQKSQDSSNLSQEAAAKTANRLREAQEKLNGALGAVKTDGTDRMKQAQKDLAAALASAGGNATKAKEAQDAYDRTVRGLGEDTSKTKKAYDEYNSSLRDIQAEASKTAQSNKEVQESFRRVMDEILLAGNARLERASNLVKLAARVPADVIKELEGLGPEYSSFIATLTTKSDEELAKLIPSFRLGGENSAAALGKGLADALPSLQGKGKEAGEVASKAFADAILRAVNGDGDIKGAIKAVEEGIQLSEDRKIPLQLAIDISAAKSNLGEVVGLINNAEKSGQLTAEVAVELRRDIFTRAVASLNDFIKTTGLDPIEGQSKLNRLEYDRQYDLLKQSSELATVQNLMGIEGLAELNPEAWKEAKATLEALGIQVTESNSIGMSGKATLTEEEYMSTFRQMERDAVNKGNQISLHATASLDTSDFKTSLSGIVQASYGAGKTISSNLTTSATVTVGYTYKNNNQPPNPNQYINAAKGGWVSGPGGPTDDRVRANLSNGEFVVNAKAAKRYGSLLQSINDFGLGGQRGLNIPSISGTPVTRKSLNRGRPVDQAMRPRRYQSLRQDPRTVITVNNNYPQAEPTSTTVNRSLAYAAALNGTF